MKCATHPEVETDLRCGKCGKAICPSCMVQTPVGARCPDCARLRKLPTFSVSTQYYLGAIVVGLGMAIVGGIVWRVVIDFVPLFYLNFLLAPAAGSAIGEVVSLSVNRKRGKGLAVIASVAVVISYLISVFSPWRFAFSLFSISRLGLDLLALIIGIFAAVRPFALK